MSDLLSRRAFLQAGVAGLASGCGASLADFPFDMGVPIPGGAGLGVRYFSVGCFLCERGGIGLLTDPFWSHLPLGQVALRRIGSDPAQVDPHLSSLSKVQAVLVGHGHYDHALDLPRACDHLAPGAKIFGSPTLAHQFAALDLPRELIALSRGVATPDAPGLWRTAAGGRLRIMPILSGHPPQWLFFHLFRRQLTEDAKHPPRRVWHYQEGITLAFLVDWLDPGGQIAHRVYIQTSSRGWPDGYFPASILDEREVDVALLAMDCARIAADGPSIIDFLAPKTVIFCHWEDFFRTRDQTPKEIVKVDMFDLDAALPSTPAIDYRFPGWDATFWFPDGG